MRIECIIPTYKPDRDLFKLLDGLLDQSMKPDRIILINTEERFFEDLLQGSKMPEKYEHVQVFHISKDEFDHGRTRNFGVEKSTGDMFIMMTQDAFPKDEHLIENLVRPLEDSSVAVSYARQLPKKDCYPEERLTRDFNYPPVSRVKSGEDLSDLGIKTFFCSNVCAAYNRETFEKLGGFVNRAIFNEDMLYAAKAVKAGYRIAYAAEAEVFHSHNYTNSQQFHRNFDNGVSQADNEWAFKGISSESEGMKMVKTTVRYLMDNKKAYRIPVFVIQCFCKYAGYLLGKNYKRLPQKLVLKLTTNKRYFE
ncbi:MAG: glycosyltransferase family 2 protein [Acetatifactor sp.]|nr:glycosyltransferase family 2 protein [Acetatifactor sp.]